MPRRANAARFFLTDYIYYAMKAARYTTLEDGVVAGKIPDCKGVVAFAENEEDCRIRLQSILESWVLLRIRLGHLLPVIHNINLNEEPYHA